MSPPITRFRHIAIEGAQPPPNETELTILQAAVGAPLPEAYRAFVEVANGARVEYALPVEHPEAEVPEHMAFSEILSTRLQGEGTIGHVLEATRADVGLPTEVLPVAREPGGSLLMLDLSPEGGGRVVALVIGRGGKPRMVDVAPSFAAWLETIELDREAVLDHLARDVYDEDDVARIEARLDIGLPEWRDDATVRGAVEKARARVGAGSAS